MEVPKIDEIRKLTKDNQQLRKQRFTDASKKAFDYILEDGAQNKIRKSANDGRETTSIYTFEFCEDPKDLRYAFEGVRMLDIINHGNLLDLLRDFFSGYYVGFRKFQAKNDRNGKPLPSRYSIFVSWAAAHHNNRAVEGNGNGSGNGKGNEKESDTKNVKPKQILKRTSRPPPPTSPSPSSQPPASTTTETSEEE